MGMKKSLNLTHPAFDAVAARAALDASLPMFLECPSAAWALMRESRGREERAGLDPDAPGGLAELRARYFLIEKAALFAPADHARAIWSSDRQGVLDIFAGLDRVELLEPYLRAYPEGSRYDAFSAMGESLLNRCQGGQEPSLRCLSLWGELKLIAATPKRANQALAAGRPEVSRIIRKPTLASFRDYLQEHPKRWSVVARDFFEPVVRAALAKATPGSVAERGLKEAFSAKFAIEAQMALRSKEPSASPERVSAEALSSFYEWMPDFCYEAWANQAAFPAAVFLERHGQARALERLLSQPAMLERLARGAPASDLRAISDPEFALQSAMEPRGYLSPMYGSSRSASAEVCFVEAALLAGAPELTRAALAVGRPLPVSTRLAAIAKACPPHYLGQSGQERSETIERAQALRESVELGALLPATERKRPRGPL